MVSLIRSITFCVVALLVATAVCGAPLRRVRQHKAQLSEKVADAYSDSLAVYKAKVDSLFAANDSLRTADGVEMNGKYFRIFSPLNFYHGVASYKLGMDKVEGDTIVDNALMNIYLKHPELVRTTDSKLSGRVVGAPSQEADAPLKPKLFDMKSQVVRVDEKANEVSELRDKPVDLFVEKPNFWKFSGDYYLQLLQNYVTENWYKGGSNNYSMLGTVTLQYNYNNKQKVKWNNKLEMKLGFQNTESDTVNHFKAMEDLIRYTSNLGLQAHKNWYYTAQVIASTQFAQGRKNNQTKVYSDFMSPFNLNVSLGMDYTVRTRNNKLRGNVHLAPIAYNLKYVDRLDLSRSFGLEKDHHSLHDYGSQMTTEIDWEPSSMFKWHTRLYAYTTYEKFQLDWENTLTFKFNRYISANLFLYPRFDDSVDNKEKYSYWQFNEYLSLGFSYSM